MSIVRVRLNVTGLVQGVGFRPFVWKIAEEGHCTGWVRNSPAGVEIELQGTPAAIEQCLHTIRDQPPSTARVASLTHCSIEVIPGESEFVVAASTVTNRPVAYVSPDLSTCQDCLAELNDPSDRRYGYPFINCTHCGPRFTIQRSLPYDREQTTMCGFQMCEQCRHEYLSPSDRRFHAQPNACPACGPTIWYCPSPHDSSDKSQWEALAHRPTDVVHGFKAAYQSKVIQSVRDDIAAGKIVAIKGIGGFHLACDARQPDALLKLRARKKRPFKPLAVMVRDLETAASIVQFSAAEGRLLTSRERPIVLLRKRANCRLPEAVAPDNPCLGVLLTYSPLHELLLQPSDIWVMTSGNLSDEPIAYENNDALARLGALADMFLMHDRPIHNVCDDSVLRGSSCGPIPIRRSRGYAPVPVSLNSEVPCVLAAGGELKAAVGLSCGHHIVLGQHIGDMGNVETLLAFERSCEQLQALYQSTPEILVADLHPGYQSTAYTQQQASLRGMRFVQVQHHHAHAASLIAEHGLPFDQPILACVFDGTGFGPDRAIWGGELLLATARSFTRVAHLKYAPLPGGDKCILQPARTALAFLFSAGIPWSDELACVKAFKPTEVSQLRQQLVKQLNVAATSSMGRLFDAVAALLGLRQVIDYEGQAAMELESLAESAMELPTAATACYPYSWSDTSPSEFDFAPMLKAICDDLFRAGNQARIAYQFHRTIAVAFAEKCQRVRASLDSQGQRVNYVGLTGGVFQNALLLQLMDRELKKSGFDVLLHQVVPPNDGGLALGQALVAACS